MPRSAHCIKMTNISQHPGTQSTMKTFAILYSQKPDLLYQQQIQWFTASSDQTIGVTMLKSIHIRYCIITDTNPIPLKSTGLTFMLPTMVGAAMRFCGSATISVCYGNNTIIHIHSISHKKTCKYEIQPLDSKHYVTKYISRVLCDLFFNSYLHAQC